MASSRTTGSYFSSFKGLCLDFAREYSERAAISNTARSMKFSRNTEIPDFHEHSCVRQEKYPEFGDLRPRSSDVCFQKEAFLMLKL
jgi:hypothetical protein